MSSEQLSMLDNDGVPAGKLKPASVSLSKTIDAPAQKVFDRWLIPVFVGEWMFGNAKIVNLENTVRRGGEFSYTTENKDGERNYHGSFESLRIPDTLSFSWIDSKHEKAVNYVTVNFQEVDGRTKIKLNIKIDPKLNTLKDAIKLEWAERCNALADKFTK